MKKEENELVTKPMLKAELKTGFKAFEKRFEKKLDKKLDKKFEEQAEFLAGTIQREFARVHGEIQGIRSDLAAHQADLDQNAVEHGQMKERLDGHDKLIEANQEDLDLLIAKG